MKLYKLLGFAGIIIIALLLLGAQTVFARTTGVISSGNTINVRQEASTDSEIVKTVPRGTQLDIIAVSGEFHKVNINGTNGVFVGSGFITIQTAEGRIGSQAVNIRSHPSLTGEIIGRAASGSSFTVTGIVGDWFAVNYNSGSAYIHSDFLTGAFLEYVPTITPPPQAAPAAQTSATASAAAASISSDEGHIVVTAQTGVNFRVGPSQQNEIIFIIRGGEAAQFLGEQDGWFHIRYDGHEGFIYSEFAERRLGITPAPVNMPIIPAPDIPPSQQAQEIIDFAKQFLGTPYRWGGTDLRGGVDCSGFTFAVFRNFGISLNRSSRDQINNGTRVERNNLQAGDLVFFNTGGNTRISHVGLYIGGGQFIHSGGTPSNPVGVIISSLYEDYYIRTYVGATRVLQ